MADLSKSTILAFITRLGERQSSKRQLFLLGGSALCLLGSPRPTADIDYVGDDLEKHDEFQNQISEIADEMKLDVEPVAIERFLPLPSGSFARNIFIGKFGTVEVFIFDPYSIALSKIGRGFDSDIDDVVYLIRQNIIHMDELERLIADLLPQARSFDISPLEFTEHFQDIKMHLNL